MNINKIVSPTLLLDKQLCLGNIKMMSDKAKLNNLTFRPHFKTHQSIIIGNWFRKAGVQKITVSSIQMAEYFARENWKDITVAFPVNIREIEQINDLAEEIQLNLTVENIESVGFLEKNLRFPVKIFIKIDTGYHRTGIDAKNTGLIEDILVLCKKSKWITFAGFLSHFGHTYHANSKEEISEIFRNSLEKLKQLKEKYIVDFPELILSVGDTPSCSILDNYSGADEIRPGNFVFYDLMQFRLGSCTIDQIAVCMACPIVAIHKERKEIIIHGGAVHFSKEYILVNGKNIYGQVANLTNKVWQKPSQDYYLTKISQEHGTIQADEELITKLNIGDLIGVVPVHSCLTANMMKSYYTTDNEWIDHMAGNM